MADVSRHAIHARQGPAQCSGYNTARKQSRNQLGVDDAHTSSGLSSNASSTTLTKLSGARQRETRATPARRPRILNQPLLTATTSHKSPAAAPWIHLRRQKKSARRRAHQVKATAMLIMSRAGRGRLEGALTGRGGRARRRPCASHARASDLRYKRQNATGSQRISAPCCSSMIESKRTQLTYVIAPVASVRENVNSSKVKIASRGFRVTTRRHQKRGRPIAGRYSAPGRQYLGRRFHRWGADTIQAGLAPSVE